MKKVLLPFFMLCLFVGSVRAKKLIVTSAGDNTSSPTIGMLRYFVGVATSNDTITFSVKKVTLFVTIKIDKPINIDGSSMGSVTIDGNKVCQIFDVNLPFDKAYFKGLNIVNGYINKNDYSWGGGMNVYSPFGKIYIENCTFQGNEAKANGTSDGQGGAVRSAGGEYRNCYFLDNKITGTSSTSGGGGVLSTNDIFINCVFAGNAAKYAGGLGANSKSKIYNCTFVDNKVTTDESYSIGGLAASASTEIVNCVAYNNTTSSGRISNIDDSDTNAKVSFCAMESINKLVGLNNNIALTASPFKGGTGSDKYSLAAKSPCIDKGTIVGIEVLKKDITGKDRILDGKIDIGAFEYSPTISAHEAILDADFQVYPNPAAATLFISGVSDITSLSIYDNTGRMLLQTNDSSNTINISTLENGIFVLKISTKSGVATRLFTKY